MRVLYVFIISFIIIAELSSGLTARIGNSLILVPAEVEQGNPVTIEKTISIENTNPVAVDVALRTSNEIKDVVELVDNNFVLKSRESKNARFNIKLSKSGEYVGTIWVKISSTNEVPIELPVKVVISAKSKGGTSQDEETLEDKNNETQGTNVNFTGIFQNIWSRNSVITLLSLSTTILSCILLFILYRIKNKKDKKRREQGTLRKVDKNRLKNK